MTTSALRSQISALVDRARGSSIGARLARGAFWSLAATVGARVLTAPTYMLLARLLGKEIFGQLGMVQGTVAMCAAFAGLGTGPTATKYVAQLREKDPARAGRILALSGVTAWTVGALTGAILFALAPWLAARTLKAPELATPLRVGIGILFFGAANGAQAGALAGLEAFKLVARITAITSIVSFPVTLLGAWLGGLSGAMWGWSAAALLTWVVYHVALRREARRFGIELVFAGCTREWPTLWKFSIPALLAGLMVGPVNWAAMTLLVQGPRGYEENGVFAVASQWRQIILFFPAAFSGVLLPVLANLQGIRDRAEYARALRLGVSISSAVAGVAALAVSAASLPIMLAHGPSFRDGWPALVFMAASGVMMAIAGVLGTAIISAGRMWLGLWLNAAWAAAYLAATWLLVHRGATGIAAANLVAYAFHVLTIIPVVRWMLAQHATAAPEPSAAE